MAIIMVTIVIITLLDIVIMILVIGMEENEDTRPNQSI